MYQAGEERSGVGYEANRRFSNVEQDESDDTSLEWDVGRLGVSDEVTRIVPRGGRWVLWAATARPTRSTQA